MAGIKNVFLTEANRDKAFKPDYLLGKFSFIGHENFLQIYSDEQSLINEQWRWWLINWIINEMYVY